MSRVEGPEASSGLRGRVGGVRGMGCSRTVSGGVAALGLGPVTSGGGTGALSCVATVSISSFRRSGAVGTAACVRNDAPKRMSTGLNPSESPGMLPVVADAAGNARVGLGPTSGTFCVLILGWAAYGAEEGQTALFLERDRVVIGAFPRGDGRVPLALTAREVVEWMTSPCREADGGCCPRSRSRGESTSMLSTPPFLPVV